MCTLILAWQVFEDAPVVVAANRDEAETRPAEPPALRDGDPRFVAPLDLEAGGTWMGYNEAGLFVGITNRWRNYDSLQGDRSRGLLVRDALSHRTAEDAARFVERELDEREYGPFHLVLADANAAVLVSWDGTREVRTLDPGVHMVVNVGYDGDYFVPEYRPDVGEQQARDADRLWEALRPEPGETAREWTDRAGDLLGDHDYGRCIHGDGYGTRSSSLLRLGPEGGVLEHAEGKPCEVDHAVVETPF